ncbi:MAG: alpha/beta fold hydrolase [Gemmatimonadales bacterium]|nr:alpha/beta fold hydrolase [Gemmatimonadales bacterium]
MNPFFFGRSERPLFGIYHAPKPPERGTGVLICPPIGQEYMRTHRALRQLALQLTKVGFPVLRFDYSGVGDSSGLDTEASLDRWLDDTATAADELKDTAGVKRIALVGIRLGAALALRAAERRTDVDSVVLWDPVVRGGDYVGEMIRLNAPPGSALPPDDGRSPMGMAGFALTPALRRDLEQLDLAAAGPAHRPRLFLIVSEERAEYLRLRDGLAGLATPSTYQHIPAGGEWAAAERLGAALLPHAIIQGIVSDLS